jgi:hypothetical protein
MRRMSIGAPVLLAAWSVALLVGCSRTDALGSPASGGASGSGGMGPVASGGASGSGGMGPVASGGASGSGGTPATGGEPYIGTGSPGGQSGSGGSAGAGGSLGTGGSSTSDAGGSLAELCSTTGGTISSQLCCASDLVSDFPDSCSVGACSCAPTSSKMVSTCSCKAGTCFDHVLGCRPRGDAGP